MASVPFIAHGLCGGTALVPNFADNLLQTFGKLQTYRHLLQRPGWHSVCFGQWECFIGCASIRGETCPESYPGTSEGDIVGLREDTKMYFDAFTVAGLICLAVIIGYIVRTCLKDGCGRSE